MLSIRAAIGQLWPAFEPLGTERVPLLAACGRVLACELRASVPLPEFDHSAMDGYAVRHTELAQDAWLPVHGEVRAGAAPQPLAAGTAVRIMTGAALPAGADTVVMQEHVERSAERMRVVRVPGLGANVRRRGGERAEGDLLLRAGTALGPAEIGLLATQGTAEVEVQRQPRVAILPTGDELRPLAAEPRAFSIADSNSYALAAAVQQAGCIAVPLAIGRDDLPELTQRIRAGLEYDLLITIGGVSVGDYDFVSEALRAVGVAVAFHKVAIKPGKPLLFGVHGRTPVIGLPGNPVSALVTFEVFVRPALRRMQGLQDAFDELVEVVLAAPFAHKTGRTEFVRASVTYTSGQWIARVHAAQSSAALTSLTGSTALVVLPSDQAEFAAGERLSALLVPAPRRSDTPFAE